MWETILFYGFGGLAVLLGLLVILFKNPVDSAVALIGNLFCVAALFALLDAHFLAVIQILLYAGAILVLFLFVIMLLNLKTEELGRARRTSAKWIGLVLLVWSALLIVGLLLPEETVSGFRAVDASYGSIETVGRLIFGRYLLPFEVTSVLLLAAIIGSVAIAKKKLW